MRLKTLVAAAALLASAAIPGNSAEPKTEFKIGLVAAFSGPFSTYGEGMKRGIELAIEQRGGKVLGVPITLTSEDDETKPQVAVQKVTQVLASGVDLLVGSVSSGSTLAIMKPIEQKKVPHLVTISASDDITGKSKSPYTFRTSDNSAMYNTMSVEFIKKKGFKKIYGVASDYAVQRDGLEAIIAMVRAEGIEVVGTDFPPLDAKDYSVIVDKIAASGADSILTYMGSGPGVAFIKQASQVGLTAKAPIFGPVLMNEIVANATGEAAVGVFSGFRYQFAEEGEANKAFVEAFRAKYGEWPSEEAGETYDGVSWFLDVVEQTGGWDPEAWMAAFRTSKRENSIQGVKEMRTCDQQASQHGLWGEVAKGGGDLPPFYMKITEIFPADGLFAPCG